MKPDQATIQLRKGAGFHYVGHRLFSETFGEHWKPNALSDTKQHSQSMMHRKI